MKGIVFTEFLDHVEHQIGPIATERLVESCNLESGGAYTAVGTYPCAELGQLMGAFCATTGSTSSDVMNGFGHHLAAAFHQAYPDYFNTPSYFDFVESIDSHIHVEVQKLYPDAELPRFRIIMRADDELIIDYISSRGLEDLAHGLLAASARVFGEQVRISSSRLEIGGEGVVRFLIEKAEK